MGLLLLLLGLAAGPAAAQPTSIEELGSWVVERFRSGTPEDFAAVYPFPEGRAIQAEVVKRKYPTVPGLVRVIKNDLVEAVVLLSFHPKTPNSGDAVGAASELGRLYLVYKEGPWWRLVRRLPIDGGNQILTHDLDVTVVPNHGLKVVDRIRVRMHSEYGWTAYLNNSARVRSAAVNGKPARFEFGASLLWVEAPAEQDVEIRLEYEMEVEEGPDNNNSACFLKAAGHVRNQYVWHPFYWFGNENDNATFRIAARIPMPYYLTTSLPQTESVEGETRVIHGESIRKTPALTLSYDRDWKPQRLAAGKSTLEIFATPEFQPSPKEIAAEFQSSYEMLEKRFGAPSGGYFAVVQGRSRSGTGWQNLANHAMFAGSNGGPFYQGDPVPRAGFFHEVSHAWISAAAPADHFLGEGWAAFAESILLREKLGEAVVRRFWESRAKEYFDRQDGKSRLLQDPANQGVAYTKGAWIFHMLEERLGRERFDAFIRQLSATSQNQPATLEKFYGLAEKAQSGTAAFLKPYVEETSAPAITGIIDGSRIVLEQSGTTVPLLLEVDVETASGKRREIVSFESKSATVNASGPVLLATLDPEWKLLLHPKSRSVIHSVPAATTR